MKLLKNLLILASLCSLSNLASAAEAQPVDQLHLRGTFCSATTLDGTWGFFFGPNDIFTNCRIVEDALRYRTRAPIDQYNRGYFLTQGWNEAVVTCGFLRSSFYGNGSYPLQNAFNYAQQIFGQNCLFEVYF